MKKILFVITLVGLSIAGLMSCSSNTNSANSLSGNYDSTKNGASGLPNSNNSNSNSMNSNKDTSNSNMAGNSSSSKDNSFMNEAAQGGMSEVELGKLAASKAQNAEVKQFGQKMVTDHSKANDELKALAGKKGITLPADVNAEQKSDMDKLKGLSGAEFDKEYVKMMVEDHEKDVKEFQTQSESAADTDVKAFAAKTLPTLKMHLEMIKSISGKMK